MGRELQTKIEEYVRFAGHKAKALQADLLISSKGNDYRNVVTNVDIAISNQLKASIAADFPNDHFYSEEETTVIDPNVQTWVIDPIDGTSNYVRSLPYYSSCATVLHHDQVAAAALYSPMLNECFVLTDQVVTLNGEPVTVSDVSSVRNAYVNFHPGRKDEHNGWAGELNCVLLKKAKKSMNLCSSGLDLCYVACGRCDILIYGSLTTIDIAGAIAMVRASGGEVYNYDTKQPVAFTETPQRIIATANRELLDEFFAVVTPR